MPEYPAWQSKILAIQSRFGLCFSLTGSVPPTPVKSEDNAQDSIDNDPVRALAEALIAVGQNIHLRYLNVPKLAQQKPQRNHSHQQLNGEEATSSQEAGSQQADTSGEGVEEQQADDVNPVDLDKIKVHESDVELWIKAWTEAVRSASTLSRLNLLHVSWEVAACSDD